MEMPKSIRLFEQLFLGSLIFGVIQSALIVNEMGVTGDDVYKTSIFQAAVIFFTGVLVLLTSRKKSVFCKWLLVMLMVLGLIEFIPALAFFIKQGVMGWISAVQITMQAFAVYFLFNSDSKEWFASRKVHNKNKESNNFEIDLEPPKSIKIFEKLFIFIIFLFLLQFVNAVNIEIENGNIANDEIFVFIAIVILFATVAILFFGGLVFFTTRRKSVLCKWVLVLILAVHVVYMAISHSIVALISQQSFFASALLLQIILEIVAVNYLIKNKDNKEWFVSKKVFNQ